MKDYFSSLKLKIISGVCLVLIGAMIYSASRGGNAGYAEGFLGALAAPFQKANAYIVNNVSDFFIKLGDYDRLKEENEQLRTKIRQLQTIESKVATLETENDFLKESLSLTDRLTEMSLTKADVIGKDPTGWFDMITVDKGSLDGVSVRDPVISSGSLIGFVSEVYLTYSKVTTILDTSFECGGMVPASSSVGAVEGDAVLRESGKCKLSYLPRDTLTVAGDMVVTSGLGGAFPKNIIIGTVDGITVESHGISVYAVITPYTDISTLRSVYVITEFTGQE